MEFPTTLNKTEHIYNKESFGDLLENMHKQNSRLFATFTPKSEIEKVVENIKNEFSGLCSKLFVLEVVDTDEYVLTYNIENYDRDELPDNTIMVHRKKETNTLYTINALNELIKTLNGGIVDKNFVVEWEHYKFSILLLRKNEFKQLKTVKKHIIDL